MVLIGLTGGMASGKSTIARRLEQCGALRLDADQLARDAVEAGSRGLRLVAERFGADVVGTNGSLDRQRLADIVFADVQALADLEAIIHPEVRRRAAAAIAAARSEDPDRVVVYEVPLLVEAEVDLPWDLVVVAEAPPEVRRDRAIRLRGMSPEEADRRIAAQANDAKRRAIADVVIDTGGSEAETIRQTDELWKRVSSDPSGR